MNVITLVILKTLRFLLLQVSPYFSQAQKLDKEDAPSVKHCNGSYKKVFLSVKIYWKVYCRIEFSFDTVTLIVSTLHRQKELLIKKNAHALLTLSLCSLKAKDFFQVLRRRENDAFNAKHRSYKSSTQICTFLHLC